MPAINNLLACKPCMPSGQYIYLLYEQLLPHQIWLKTGKASLAGQFASTDNLLEGECGCIHSVTPIK